MSAILYQILATFWKPFGMAWARFAQKLPPIGGYAEVRGELRIGRRPRQRQS